MNLAGFEQRWFSIIASALIPVEVFGEVRSDIDFAAELARTCVRYPVWSRAAFRLALWTIWLAPLMKGKLRSFGGLPYAERQQLLVALLDSPVFALRELCNLFKLIACMVYVGDIDVLRHIGAYDLRPTELIKPSAQVIRRAS